MPDTVAILKAITKMHSSFDSSLDKVYAEIKGCNIRVTEIETALAVKKALCKKKKEDEKEEQEKTKETRSFWRSILRMLSVAGIIALCALVWGKLIALWEMLP